jgi:hypothetical protein
MLRLVALAGLLAVLACALPAAAQQSLGFGYIERKGTEAGEGKEVPPWTRIRIHGGFVALPAKKMLTGEATIVPFDPALPPINLAIKTLHPYQREECTGEMSKTRSIDFPDVTHEAYRSYVGPDAAHQNSPGQVLIVHPVARKARSLPKQSVAAGDLPRGYPLATLDAAFDLSGGGKPEAVQLTYCCKNPRFDQDQCKKADKEGIGVTCTALFHKTKAGWSRLYMSHNQDC